MKKSILSVLLFYAFTSTAQVDPSNLKIDTSKLKTIELPDSTAIATPYGNVISKIIGQDGGSLASEDGKLELIFPQGALTANTTITIQWTRNMLDSSKYAYQLEPSGNQFNKPVKIIFHYTDKEAENCPPELKSFALQDHNGKWSYLEYEDWDSTGKTLSGFIQHFSVIVTDQDDVLLKPDKRELGVNEQTFIDIWHKKKITSGPSIGDYEDPRFSGREFGIFVNDVQGGNDLVGTASIMSNRPEARIVGYTAPGKIPFPNPVKVKFAFQYWSKRAHKVKWGSASCEIFVWEVYQIKIIHQFYTREGLDGRLLDSATCLAEIRVDHVKISGIKNYKPIVIREGRNPPFREKLYIDEAQGTLHLTESYSAPTHYSFQGYPGNVYIEFNSVPVTVYKYKHGARGVWTEIEAVVEKSLFLMILFQANGKEQHYKLDVPAKEYGEVIVKPMSQ